MYIAGDGDEDMEDSEARYERQSRMETAPTYDDEYYNDNATHGEQYDSFEPADDDGDKFDPSEFFSSFANHGGEDEESSAPPRPAATLPSAISADLQLSESDSDDDL